MYAGLMLLVSIDSVTIIFFVTLQPAVEISIGQ